MNYLSLKNKKPNQCFNKSDYKKVISINRKAYFDYIIEDKIQAGISLLGSEVKSLRTKNADCSKSYAYINNGECFLIGLHIETYDKTCTEVPSPTRDRKLLLSKKELVKIQNLLNRSGYTLMPLELAFFGNFVKVILGLGKGKTFSDKRQALKDKTIERESKQL